MGRSTSGVTGMKFRGDDELLSMAVVPEEGSEAEQAKEVTRLARGDPAGLAEILVIGLAAHRRVGIGGQVTVMAVVDVHGKRREEVN